MARNPKPPPLPPQLRPKRDRIHLSLTGLFSLTKDAATCKLILRDTAFCFYLIGIGLLVKSFMDDQFMDKLPINAVFILLASVLRGYQSFLAALILLLISLLTFGSKLSKLLSTEEFYTSNPEHAGLAIMVVSTTYICLRSMEAIIRLRVFAARAGRKFRN